MLSPFLECGINVCLLQLQDMHDMHDMQESIRHSNLHFVFFADYLT